jgi:hypothetical protein
VFILKNIFKPTMRLAVLSGILLSQYAHAGGLPSATQGATTFSTWLYAFLGVCAVIYLGWKGAEAWMDRGHWSDFVMACGKVAVVGSVVVLAPWLWSMFTS